MLRIVSSKIAQKTPGDLSIPGTNEQVLQPYTTMKRFLARELQKRRQEKARNRPNKYLAHYERFRDPAHGQCPNCGNFRAIDERGRRFCPSPECNVSRPQFRFPSAR
ncbi:hypothetical protein LCGC14_2260930 [marine sediment metagenome]|uniref:Uncharacterized protein n=1 Tax=marine sediment metagenome TaxID=412755 RepID=A0A0F9DM39_9ZZZZ